MDINCPKCGEPWENDTLHDYAEEHGSTYAKVAKVFRTKGCAEAFPAWKIGTCQRDENAELRFALVDILGDDMDGYASTLADFGI